MPSQNIYWRRPGGGRAIPVPPRFTYCHHCSSRDLLSNMAIETNPDSASYGYYVHGRGKQCYDGVPAVDVNYEQPIDDPTEKTADNWWG